MADPARLMAEALALGAHERAAMVVRLLESLDGNAEADVDAAWDAEIRRRVEEVRDGTVPGEPLDIVIRELDEVVDGQA